jgi:hypothetical protein
MWVKYGDGGGSFVERRVRFDLRRSRKTSNLISTLFALICELTDRQPQGYASTPEPKYSYS